MEPNSKEVAPSVPINPNLEKEAKRELLLNQRYAGLHGALLLNGEMPGTGKALDTDKLQDVKKNILAGKSFETSKLTNGSKQERDDYWAKKTEYKSFEEQKNAWIDSTKKFLEYYNNKPEMEILGKLGMRAGGENEIYDKYFSTAGEGKGDIGYFATTVSTKLERDEIENYSELIGKIGGFYGENSSAVAKHLTEAVKNVKVNYPDFEKVSVEQFAQGESMEGIDILKGVDERSKRWDENQKQKEAEEKQRQEKAAEEEVERKRKKEAEQKPQPEVQSEKEKEIRDLIASLTKFDEKVREKATDIKFSFSDKYTEEEIEKIRKTDWGPGMIDEYQKKFDLLRGKIDETVKAGDATTEKNIKFSELKEGDIFAEKGNEDDNVLVFKGKGKENIDGVEKDVYRYHVLGKDLEFVPYGYATEEDYKDSVVQKLVFVNKAQGGSETKASEVIAKELDDAIEKYNKSGSKIIKDFVPVLESLKGDHKDIPESDYQNFVKRVLGGFLLASGLEDSGKEKEQLLHLIGSFDLVYAHHNELMNKNTDPWFRRYYEERINRFEELLKKEGVERVEKTIGKKFDENIMNKLGEKEVDEDKVDMVLDEFIPGFTFKGEHLRRSSVGVGKAKEISDKT